MQKIKGTSVMKNILKFVILFFMINISLNATIINPLLKFEKLYNINKIYIGHSLPNSEITRLSLLSTKQIGIELGKRKLSKNALEDVYVRIAIEQKKISRVEAEEFYKHLHGVDGFRSTLSKVVGKSPQKTAGHLNELKIANVASRNGFKTVGIGVKYQDGLKKAPTDIDIILKKDSKTFIIEAKDYSSTTKLPLDKYRADLDTLNVYKKEHNTERVIAIFSITNKPKDEKYLKLLKKEAKRRNVELIFGTPSQQTVQINQLNRITK